MTLPVPNENYWNMKKNCHHCTQRRTVMANNDKRRYVGKVLWRGVLLSNMFDTVLRDTLQGDISVKQNTLLLYIYILLLVEKHSQNKEIKQTREQNCFTLVLHICSVVVQHV